MILILKHWMEIQCSCNFFILFPIDSSITDHGAMLLLDTVEYTKGQTM